MTPALPNADELEVVAYWHECRNKNGQLWDWTVSQDAEMEFSTEHAPGSGEDYIYIAKPLVTISSAQAQIERLTDMLDGYGKLDAEYAIMERRAEAAEAEVKRLREALEQAQSNEDRLLKAIDATDLISEQKAFIADHLERSRPARTTLSGGTSNG